MKSSNKLRDKLLAPFHIVAWGLVAGVVVACSIAKRDKPRQKTTGENPLPGYITGVTGSHDGRKVHDCPRHG